MDEQERWVMRGLSRDDPACIRSPEELERYIEDAGFLPLFRCEIPGFSVEEHTAADGWWTDDPTCDPWAWRQILAERGNVAYGKFFDRKAGFISKKWFPVFANYRRDGYDFDSLWDEEKASVKSKKIMEHFFDEQMDRELFSFELKEMAGFGKTGEKNFEGEITNLQMQTYLCIRDFRRRRNRRGEEYGWGIAVYCTPEHLWGYDHISGEYRNEPAESAQKLYDRVRELYPAADDRALRKVLGIRNIGSSAKPVLAYPDNLIKALRIEGLTPESMTADQKAGLEVAIGQLRDKQQRVIRMKYREHRKNEEIGKLINRAAGTVGTYHTKAMKRLKGRNLTVWYRDGYESALCAYMERQFGITPEKLYRDDKEPVVAEDYCLRLGIGLKTFESMMSESICTVSDLVAAMHDPEWYRPVHGIGPKTAADIAEKLGRIKT